MIRRKGDHDGSDTWLRIIVAIGETRRFANGRAPVMVLIPGLSVERRHS